MTQKRSAAEEPSAARVAFSVIVLGCDPSSSNRRSCPKLQRSIPPAAGATAIVILIVAGGQCGLNILENFRKPDPRDPEVKVYFGASSRHRRNVELERVRSKVANRPVGKVLARAGSKGTDLIVVRALHGEPTEQREPWLVIDLVDQIDHGRFFLARFGVRYRTERNHCQGGNQETTLSDHLERIRWRNKTTALDARYAGRHLHLAGGRIS
uniref:Uncharacterized protein n=1 Tax=Anopheles culicifacies TaxID=139723 RepID=A0A182MM97_9DIPT